MPEEQIMQAAMKIEESIKVALLKKHMSQVELSRLINEGTAQTNRAIKGGMTPKDVEIRQKIYRWLDL